MHKLRNIWKVWEFIIKNYGGWYVDFFVDSYKQAKDREDELVATPTNKSGESEKSTRKAALAGREFLKKVTSCDDTKSSEEVSWMHS